MFNWSWKLRKQTEFISPVGPGFNWAPTELITINGSRICVKLPRQKTDAPLESITFRGERDVHQLENIYQESNGVKYRYSTAFKREWDFNGPWFTGRRGGISMIANFISLVDAPEGINFFNPRAFESGIASYLTAFYGDLWSDSTPYWQVPVNWQPLERYPCIATRFKAHNNVTKIEGPACFLVLPVAKTHFLIFKCGINRAAVLADIKPRPSIDEWIDLQPFLTLANQVLDSVRIELSDQAKAEQEDALSRLSVDERRLVAEYPPLKWQPPPPEPVDDSWMENVNT